MLVLSRQVDETVMIGDSISVTVVSIGSEIATLFVRYRDETQRVEQKLALEVDDRLEITNDIHVYVVEIRQDKVRLGIVAPAVFAVHRREVYEAIKNTNPRAVSTTQNREADPDTARISKWDVGSGQSISIGSHLEIVIDRTPSGDRELRSRGQLLGGARDGEEFERRDPISIGSVLEFGSLVRVRVAEITAETVGLKIEHPLHIICRVKN
jgi:carbon storage regulator CsrA